MKREQAKEAILKYIAEIGGALLVQNWQEADELLAALNWSEKEYGDPEKARDWRIKLGRGRQADCIRGEIASRKEHNDFPEPTSKGESQDLARAESSDEVDIAELLKETKERKRRESSNPEIAQHCDHCQALTKRMTELERRLTILETQVNPRPVRTRASEEREYYFQGEREDYERDLAIFNEWKEQEEMEANIEVARPETPDNY